MVSRIFISSIFLFFSFSVSFSQNTVNYFGDDTSLFPEKIEEIYKSVTDRKFAKEFQKTLVTFWENPELNEDFKIKILTTCNKLAVKRARPLPDYQTYLEAMMLFYEKGFTHEGFENWHQALSDNIDKPRNPLRNINWLIEQTTDLIANNIAFSTPSLYWKVMETQYRYEYEDGQLHIDFNRGRLVCHSKSDSIQLFDTKGTLYPIEKTWVADKGRITWQRSGFDQDMIYAVFKNYQLDLTHPYFTIDSAEFYNRFYFSFPLQGQLEHKVRQIRDPENSTYPRFVSYEQRFSLTNIHPNINYDGGFAQNGAKFLGSGTDQNPAMIKIFRHDTLFVTAKSKSFALRKDQILSTDTEIKIDLDTGFIYHPGLIFKYISENNEMHLIRNGEGLATSPYFNTFHNVSMDVELIKWQIDKPYMELSMLSGAAQNQAFFESLSYYRESFYNQLQGMDAIHPLQGLKNCSNFYHGTPFTAKDYAQYMRFPESQIRQQVIGLSFYGFIGYNVNTDVIEIRQRLIDYLDFRLGKKDYDVIRFNSLTPGTVENAKLDLANFDLSLNGVSAISICDHQNVVFFPKNEEILLKRNRNFIFNGTINAGMLNLYGDGFKFSYDDFRIDMRTIDSLNMKVQSGSYDYYGQPILKPVENTIAQLSGFLQIDEPNNKSGNNSYPQFPILKSDQESFVYFDKNEIQHGKYNRETFYYKLDTFQLDSINQLTKQNFDFAGEFVSNIFPIIRENLGVRPDYSLGMLTQTPPEGYPIYNGKAQYTSIIDLSNKGLRGDGSLKYITSTSTSQDFVFLPEEVFGLAHSFVIDKQSEGVEYPDVSGRYIKMNYYPQKEYMTLDNQEEMFDMYAKEARMDGTINLSPEGLKGKGTFHMEKANLVSRKINFGEHTLLADSSNFNLTGPNMADVSFTTTNLVAQIDFKMRQGRFSSKNKGSKVEFTKNRYISFIRDFSWNMDKNEIYMGAKGSAGNRFVSIHRKQDSLDFYAPLAKYDPEHNVIVAEDVKNIKVADTNILLADGFVTVREGAVMDPLENTQIFIQDSLTSHKIYDARVIIEGKKSYNGYGNYDYINGENKKFKLSMHKIAVNKEERTYAEGKITEEDWFAFNKHFAYKGNFTMNAEKPNFTFDGATQMLYQLGNGPKNYIRFESEIDPNNVIIPIKEDIVNFERQNLYANFFLTKDSVHMYSAFFEGRKDYSDIPVITGNGNLYYNPDYDSFDLSSLKKKESADSTGVLMRFSTSSGDIYAEGPMDMGVDMGQVTTHSSGGIIHQRDENKITLSTLMQLDFFFNELAITEMVNDLRSSKALESKQSAETFIKRFSEWTNNQTAKAIETKRTWKEPYKEMPEEFNQMFTFGNIDFVWDTRLKSYICTSEADLSFIKNNPINKKVNITAEINQTRSGNSINLYIKVDEEKWYYFSYKSGIMQTLSSNESFNSIVQVLKADERKMKVGIGSPSFSFILAPKSKLSRFLRRFQPKNESDEISTDEESETEADEPDTNSETPDTPTDK